MAYVLRDRFGFDGCKGATPPDIAEVVVAVFGGWYAVCFLNACS
jgi:hypothetical protein